MTDGMSSDIQFLTDNPRQSDDAHKRIPQKQVAR